MGELPSAARVPGTVHGLGERGSNFPDLGDYPSPDRSSPNPPTSTTLTIGGAKYTSGDGKTFVGGGNSLTYSATDAVFAAGKVGLRSRAYRAGSTPSAWAPLANPGTFAIPAAGGDGAWTVEYHAENPCHTFQVEGSGPTDPLAPEPVHNETYYLDTTAPAIVVTQPAPVTYVHSATLTLGYTVTDGGSGVKVVTPTLDGAHTLAGHGLPNGQAINLLTELPLGPHTFKVDALDNVDNANSVSVSFEVIVTAESIKDDVRQFVSSGAVTLAEGMSLLQKLDAASAARARGQCATASQVYKAFIAELQAQSGKQVTAAAAAIMIADARYLIAHCP